MGTHSNIDQTTQFHCNRPTVNFLRLFVLLIKWKHFDLKSCNFSATAKLNVLAITIAQLCLGVCWVTKKTIFIGALSYFQFVDVSNVHGRAHPQIVLLLVLRSQQERWPRCIRWGTDPPEEGTFLGGGVGHHRPMQSIVKKQRSAAKTDERIKMSFRMWRRQGTRNHALDSATWRIRQNDPCAAMRP